jgi:hypothetical protein
MSDARQPTSAGDTVPPDDLVVDADPELDLGVSVDDPEVSPADAWEQSLPADPDAVARRPRPTTDPEVSPADAWDQSIPVDVDDDY